MKKYLSILRINWINALEYRGNVLIGLFAILSGLFIEYQIWSLIFGVNNHSVIAMEGVENGYSFKQLIVFIFLSIIVLGVLAGIGAMEGIPELATATIGGIIALGMKVLENE